MGPRPGMPAGFPMGGPGGFDIGNHSSKRCIFCSASPSSVLKVILWFSASGTSVLVMAPCQNGYFSYFSDEVDKFHRNRVMIPGTKLKIFEI